MKREAHKHAADTHQRGADLRKIGRGDAHRQPGDGGGVRVRPQGRPGGRRRGGRGGERGVQGVVEEGPDDRAAAMRAAISKIQESSKEIAQLLTREQGKPFSESMGELHHFLHGMNYYADLASKIEGVYANLPSTLGKAYGLVIKKPIG